MGHLVAACNSVEFRSEVVSIAHTLATARDLLFTFLSPYPSVSHNMSSAASAALRLTDTQIVLQNAVFSLADFPQQRIVVDGSWISVTDRTGLAWVWLDADNHIVKHAAILGPPMLSPQQVEAASVLHAMRWASQQGIQSLLLQTDCLVLVQLLHTSNQDSDWQLHSLLSDILLCSKNFVHVVLEKVDRAEVHCSFSCNFCKNCF